MKPDAEQKQFLFNEAERLSLTQLLTREWASSSSEHLRDRASNSNSKLYFTALAIGDLETVVGWELCRLDGRTTVLNRPSPKKRELQKIHGAFAKAINNVEALNSLNSVFIDDQFNRQRRQSLKLELYKLSRVVEQSMRFSQTGQKHKPFVWLALEVARWLLLFEIKPKKTTNMVEVLEIVFIACSIDLSSVRQAIENSWEDICQPERTWPDFCELPPED